MKKNPKSRATTRKPRDAKADVPGIPAHLLRLINPLVLEQRREQIARRRADIAEDRVLRRRAAEVITNHLLERVA